MSGSSTSPTGRGNFSPDTRPSSAHRPFAAIRSCLPERNACRGGSAVTPYQPASQAACTLRLSSPSPVAWFSTTPVTARKRKKTTAATPMRACQWRRNRSRRTRGDMLAVTRTVEEQREPRHAFHRSDRQRRAYDAVDVAVQAVSLPEPGVPELLKEGRLANFLPAALAVNEHAHVIDAPVGDDEARRDQLLLPRVLQDPHALPPLAPVPLAQLPGRVTQYRCGLGLQALGEPQHLGRRGRPEDLGDKRRRLLIHLAANRSRDQRERKRGKRAAKCAEHQNMNPRPSRYASWVLSVA